MNELARAWTARVGGPPASAVAENATQLLVLPAPTLGHVILAPGTMNTPEALAGHGAMPTRVYRNVLVPELSSATYSVGSALVSDPVWSGTLISAWANRK